MRNIYCRGSKLSSLCMRVLIERYVAGDTATNAQRFIIGAASNDNIKLSKGSNSGLCEPTGEEAHQYIDRFLSIYPSTYAQVSKFANARISACPEHWRPITISRQTVNAQFLKLGRYCWQHVAEPYLVTKARQAVEIFDEINQAFSLSEDDLTDKLVQNLAQRYVKCANGTLFADPDTLERYGPTMTFLTERARKFQGLSLARAREHMAWAFLINSVQNQRGHDDRAYGAQYLTSLLMKNPM